MKTHQAKTYDKEKHNFRPVVKAARALFGANLCAIFVHGSLFDGTFGKYSDYDIVIILSSISKNVLIRDDFAQRLKLKLTDTWEKNPFSFDFISANEIQKSAKIGHPFAKSILSKGCPIYDPRGVFTICSNALSGHISIRTRKQMAKNLTFLADRYIEISQKLLSDNEFQFALLNVSTATTLIIRALLVLEEHNIYQGEIYQFFLKTFKGKISKNLASNLWKYAFKSNQISFRLKEPHVDIPLQDADYLFKEMKDEKLVIKMLEIHSELKKIKCSLD